MWKKLTDFPNQKVIGKTYKIIFWKIENNKIWHQWKKLTSADTTSFEVYVDTDFIARDKDFIYHAWSKLKKIDRNTFKKAEGPYWKDKNHIYFEYETSFKPLKGLDAMSFVYLDNGYAYDKHFAYYYGRAIKTCKYPQSLEIVKANNLYAKDKENVYYDGGSLPNVDVATWQLLDNGYSKDKKRIYYAAKKLPRVDMDTWVHISNTYSKDIKRVYNMFWVEKDANPDDWDSEKVKQIKQ